MGKSRKMTAFSQKALLFTVLAGLAIATPLGSASAGFFELLFGSRPPPPSPLPMVAPTVRAFADPLSGTDGGERRVERSPSATYCVRLCDGRPFPVNNAGASPAQACNAFCPAAKTKVFAGSGIEYAVATDGKRYADLPTAFLYRKKLTADCTCNGNTAGGLVSMPAKDDPTLRPGDIVATNTGLVAFKGFGKNQTAEFTPIKDRKLSQIQVSPAAAMARAEAPPPPPVAAAPRDGRQRAQFSR